MLFFTETVISGLMTGVMYSLVALGFVLIFKASGILNFAQGVMALFAALALYDFISDDGWMERWFGFHLPIWLGIIMILMLSTLAPSLQMLGYVPFSEDPIGNIQRLLLPAFALSLPIMANLARLLRSTLLEALQQDYIRTARAKGLPAEAVLWRHALRNATIPVLTILGLQFAFLLAGTIIIENVFYLPGLGQLIFQAINQRDLIVVEGVVVLLVGTVVLVNFLVDLAYAWADPRLRRR